MAKKALGKGLGAIISTSAAQTDDIEREIISHHERIVNIEVDSISPNPDQPRTVFDQDAISGLSESIKSSGLLQPIIVRRSGEGRDKYLVVAGERRLRAVKLAGFRKIRAIVIEANEEQNLTFALIENIQRRDLDPIEEAKGYRVLINRFKLKQQDVADKVGKDRATVTNILRLLNLPEDMQLAVSKGDISTGHAKILLSVTDETIQRNLYGQVIDNQLSVRALEKMVSSEDESSPKKNKSSDREIKLKPAQIRKMEEKLMSRLGTKVEIKHSGKKGRIEIAYYSLEDFERILELFK